MNSYKYKKKYNTTKKIYKMKKNKNKNKHKNKLKKKHNNKCKSKKKITLNIKRYKKQKAGEKILYENYNIFNDIEISEKYHTIYIAIGAKYNNYNNSMFNTGIYQLVPQLFNITSMGSDDYRDDTTNVNKINWYDKPFDDIYENKKILIIVIDQFTQEELINNEGIINFRLERIETVSVVDYVIINQYLNDSLTDDIKNLINNLDLKKEKTNLYICDYIYFFSPNEIETNILKYINSKLNELYDLLLERYIKCNNILTDNLKLVELPDNINVYKWLGPINPCIVVKYNLYEQIKAAIIILNKNMVITSDNCNKMKYNKTILKNSIKIYNDI